MAGKWKTGKLERLIASMGKISKQEIAIGIVEKSIRSGTTSQAAIAKHLEEGPVGSKGKKWPTFRPGVLNAKYRGRMRPLIKDAIRGNAVAGLHRFGVIASNKIKSNIQGIKSPSLELSTIRKKGSRNPLVDSGRMKKSVGYKIQGRS